MSFIAELEVRVQALVKKYQEASSRVLVLEGEKRALEAAVAQLEHAMLQETAKVTQLLEEKELMKTSVDGILNTIEKLEDSQK